MIYGVGILLVAGYFIYRHKTWKPAPWPSSAVRPPLFQGHRGYWKEGAQENTLAAFAAAHNRGLKMVELDVRLSADHIPVVFHDEDLKRLGHSILISNDLTAAELKKRVQAPTLQEVLQDPLVPRLLNIELKTGKAFSGDLETHVARVVRECGAENRVLFSSFNPLAIRRLSRLLPEVPRALLASREDDPANKIYLRRLWLAPYIHAHLLHLDQNYWSPEEVQALTRKGIPVAMWTVNEKRLADQYLQAGAISIISDTLL